MAAAQSGGRSPRLRQEQREQLQAELCSPPARYGYPGEHWTGSLLADFLKRSYAAEVTPRHARRLLARLGTQRTPPRPRQPAPQGIALAVAGPARAVSGGTLDKEIALKRIRRLSSSGLPLAPFVAALWDLLHAAIPFADNRVFLAGGGANPSAHLMNNPELARWAPVQRYYYVEAPPEISGMRVRFDQEFLSRLHARPVHRSEEFALPHFYRAEGYHEFLRPLGFHHMLWVAYSEHGENLGSLPMWRGEKQPPFGADEIRLMTLAAPHIAHGLKTAYLQDASGAVAATAFLSGGAVGVAVLDEEGRVLALDPAAEAIFLQLAVLGEGGAPLGRGPGAALFSYVAHLLREIFGERGAGAIPPPFQRVHSHRTGLTLTLRGFAPRDIAGNRQFIVLIEAGEQRAHRRARAALRWGLSPTDLVLLDGLRAGFGTGALSDQLKITPGTAKAYAQRLRDKLELPSLVELRRFARETWV